MESQPNTGQKTIDVHWHLLQEDWFPEKMWQILSEQLSGHIRGDRANAVDPAEFRRTTLPKLWDRDGEKLLAKMEECNIETSIVVSDDFGVAFGEPPVPILDQNKAIADLCAKHPGKLLPMCVVDPRRKNGVDILERCIKDFGMFGVGECHPDTGWSPADREAYRMFERLQEWKVPVLMHTGLFFPPLHSRFDHPMLLDDVCSDFPELVVIAGHSGRLLWWQTVAHMAAFHPNFYGDLAGFQTLALTDFPKFCMILREYINICGPRKIMWASDDPAYDELGFSTKKYLDLMRSLPHSAPGGISFTQEEVDLILGGNAQRALKL